MIGTLKRYQVLVKQYGLRRCVGRVVHDWKRRRGLLKPRFPAWRWEERPLQTWLRPGVPGEPAGFRAYRAAAGVKFFFAPGEPPHIPAEWLAAAVREADELLAGRFRYFSHAVAQLGSPEPDWLANPFTGQREAPGRHWLDTEDFEPQRGDVKFIWEPSRFGWVFTLARAYAANRDEKYAEAFWQLLESWMRANPPQSGPNWICGQETAIRVLAATFGGYVFWNSPAATDERVAALVVMLAGSAERIAGNIDYARSQMGNHAVSEAAGIFAVGVLLPELREAEKWRRLGQFVLEDEARQFCAADGSYAQHSMNYQRLMLHDYLWSLALGERNGIQFSELTRERLGRSYEFLYQLQDETGWLPNYGPNDGALILPLNGCAYRDFRPVLGAMHYLLRRQRLYDDGPWSEDLLWLFGAGAADAPVSASQRSSRDFAAGGYYTIRTPQAWAMVRCHSYRNRPNQADMLHLDLWWRGINLLRDSGSFSYYDPAGQWGRYFVSTAAHNTVTVGDVDQMIKGPRFQWLSLLSSRFLGRRHGAEVTVWEGEHFGYRRLPSRAVHRRTIVCLGGSGWLVVDDVFGAGDEIVRLYWQLPDLAYQAQGAGLRLEMPQGVCSLHLASQAPGLEWTVLRGVDDGELRAGWDSSHYARRDAALTVRSTARGRLPMRLVTLIGLGAPIVPAELDPGAVLRWHFGDPPTEWTVRLTGPDRDLSPLAALERDGQLCELQS
jgi:asparagine synthase (glutamine-hydrolysing)